MACTKANATWDAKVFGKCKWRGAECSVQSAVQSAVQNSVVGKRNNEAAWSSQREGSIGSQSKGSTNGNCERPGRNEVHE